MHRENFGDLTFLSIMTMFRVWRTRFEFHENFEVNLKLFLKIFTIFIELKELDEQSRQSSLTLEYSFRQSQQSYLCQKLVPTIMTIFSVSKTRSNNHDNLFCFKKSFNNHDNLFCEQNLFSHNHNNRFCEQNLIPVILPSSFVSSTRHLNYVTSISTWHDCN